MSVLSKIAHSLGLQTLDTNCYETIHTWNPSCTGAILDAVPGGFIFSMKTYSSFYLLSSLVAKKDPRKIDWPRLIRDTVQSSVFLTSNLVFFLFFLCRFRQWLGFFTVPTMGLLSSILASFFAILVEKKSRRPALTLYLINLASETLYRQLVNHGYLKTIPRGEWIPFAAGLALFTYLHSKGKLPSNLSKLLNISHMIDTKKDILPLKPLPSDFKAMISTLRSEYKASPNCTHAHSCVSVATEGFVKNFGIGLGVSSALVLLKNLKNLGKPLKIVKALFSKSNLQLPLFFGLMPFLFHATRCTLNRKKGIDSTTSNVAAAAVSGLSMLTYPSISISLYTFWKAFETLYFDLAEEKKVPYYPNSDPIFYAIATGYVLWQTIIEPQSIRKGYIGFLNGLTNQKMTLFNRDLYEKFGFNSGLLYPDYKIKLDPRFCTINPQTYIPHRLLP